MEIKLHKYKICDFHNVDSIAVLCRGKSLGEIGKYKENFKNIFVAGQHVKSFGLIGKHIKGCNIVKVWGNTHTTPCEKEKKICSDYNIIDMQSSSRPHVSSRKSEKYEKIKKAYKGILTVYSMPVDMRNRNKKFADKYREEEGKLSYPTLGLYAVDLASAYKPKSIHIIGLDFYCSPNFVKEKNNASLSTNVRRAPVMIDYFKFLCSQEKTIKYYLYTCCDRIESTNNLIVIKV